MSQHLYHHLIPTSSHSWWLSMAQGGWKVGDLSPGMDLSFSLHQGGGILGPEGSPCCMVMLSQIRGRGTMWHISREDQAAPPRSREWGCSPLLGIPNEEKERYFVTTPLCNLYFSSFLLYLPRRQLCIISKLFTGPIATPECYHCLSHKNHLQLMLTLKFANITHTLAVSSSLFKPK